MVLKEESRLFVLNNRKYIVYMKNEHCLQSHAINL
jgi:hypothetical protein